jgi:hypothetical protein
MMADGYTIRHHEQDICFNADQTELYAIRNGRAPLDIAVADNIVAGELNDLEVIDRDIEEWEKLDLAMDAEVGEVHAELLRRKDILGTEYPFTVNPSSLNYTPSDSMLYEYCLGICLAPSITVGAYVELPRYFEEIVGIVIAKHLGPSWNSYRTGAPRSRGEPARVDEMFKRLSDLTSNQTEWCWNPSPQFPQEDNTTGDKGIDFVVWRRAPDTRIGQPYVAGQCACGNNWEAKLLELSFDRLKPFINPMPYVLPIRCFATPRILSDGNFLNSSTQAGWVVDRLRLVSMARDFSTDADYVRQFDDLARLFRLAEAA